MLSAPILRNALRSRAAMAQRGFARESQVNLNRHYGYKQHGNVWNTLSNVVWKKSGPRYIAYVMVGAIVGNIVIGETFDFIWEQNNSGKLYHQIDWSQFKSEDDEEESDE